MKLSRYYDVKFVPYTDLNEWFRNNKESIEFYELLQSEKYQNLFKPLDFLNLLYEKYLFVFENIEKPIFVKDHLLSLGLDKKELHFLLLCLGKLINLVLEKFPRMEHGKGCEVRMTANVWDPLAISLKLINGLNDKLEKEIYPDQKTEGNYKSNITFEGNKLEFLQLIRALIENGNLKKAPGTKLEDVFNQIATFLNFEVKNPLQREKELYIRSNSFLLELHKKLDEHLKK
jgi:hypothetical protein